VAGSSGGIRLQDYMPPALPVTSRTCKGLWQWLSPSKISL